MERMKGKEEGNRGGEEGRRGEDEREGRGGGD